jgi:hypothetical protein
MFLENMSSPHAFGIDTSVSPSAKGTAQTWLFAFWPTFWATFFQVLLLGRTPTPRWFQMGRIWDCIRVCVICGSEVIRVQKPFRVFSHEIVGEAIRG